MGGAHGHGAGTDPVLPLLAQDFGFQVVSVEDISEADLDLGWYPAKEKLRGNEEHYCRLLGESWVRRAYAGLGIGFESWRIAAVKE